MTSENHPVLTHQVLVVLCGCDLTEEANRAAQTYTFRQDVESAALLMAQSEYQCVIACVDPSKKDSIDQLARIRKSAKINDLPFATVSQFNPIWIENLMDQFDIATHFKSFPDSVQIADFAASDEFALSIDSKDLRK